LLFVVVREIEGVRYDCQVFCQSDEARSYYDQGVHVCMEEPDDTPGSDPSIVTNCWLYSTDAVGNEAAQEAALSERALLMAVCFPPEDA
jgi:hypothetical protein